LLDDCPPRWASFDDADCELRFESLEELDWLLRWESCEELDDESESLDESEEESQELEESLPPLEDDLVDPPEAPVPPFTASIRAFRWASVSWERIWLVGSSWPPPVRVPDAAALFPPLRPFWASIFRASSAITSRCSSSMAWMLPASSFTGSMRTLPSPPLVRLFRARWTVSGSDLERAAITSSA